MANINSYNPEDIRNECISRFSKDKITREILKVYDLILSKRG